MNINQLKTFIVLADCLSVTETSKRLFCTQPAVSIKIRKLEEALNTVLFERINNRLYLTEQGKIFYSYVEQIISTLEMSVEHLHQYDDPNYGKIIIGASHFVGVYLLPQVIAEYRKLSPNVELRLEILSSQQLIQGLENHSIDFIIMSDQIYFDPQKYDVNRFLSDELILIVPPDHVLAAHESCCFEQLCDELFIIKPKNSQTRKFLLQQFSKDQISMLKFMEINSLEGIKRCVMNGLGVSIISRFSVENELKMGMLKTVELDGFQFKRGINYIYHKEKRLSSAIGRFIGLLNILK
ncbi:LysR family transcriptional regulator [Aggregatibacter actinomycetemcomitans serotype e str. SC1083]|uniref:LysR family transcriptional regulator n=1 Tax=Aggregatibacter actinomycetemcomitans serotype e str. SC1083 TaxID=907488 RepID=G4ABE6_AGGAC|nr:LysR family transcriptional regulator [Aggregatibacter actinomycetemcomitans]EGY32487.1 LysR family transcriptional regulator [Aggregatibacter actinomycetemcomitans serotype e str. SC1083]KYK75143.1 LysR family transcriptional regulator [Aggregatibacter actinomycetemcomitans serotype e str. SA3096]KYK81662.1 LysR family transcriptional regulator [Aggregatibacter actinomycetemcomitans serotype e str. SC936]MBN6081066.1 LysR family transcriptional regulator [Aggregatibacter actinomycetemcomita